MLGESAFSGYPVAGNDFRKANYRFLNWKKKAVSRSNVIFLNKRDYNEQKPFYPIVQW